MKVEASTVEAHRFVRVRRKGYDPIEVDRVMERLVATLRAHEHDTAELESRVQDADDSVDAIRRTFAAAQRTRDEMINESADHASFILARARNDAERFVDHARSEVEAMVFEREEAMVRAHRSGAERLGDAEIEAYRILLDAEMTRADVVAGVEHTLEAARHEGEALKAAMLEGAERSANEIVGAARREETRLATRLSQLRNAVTDVETKINDLASLATPRTGQIARVIDLTAPNNEVQMIGSGRS